MKGKQQVRELTAAIEQVRRRVAFCAAGTLAASDPGLTIEGVGDVKMPLRPKQVQQLAAAGREAPYGQGTRTLVDKSVRDTLEIEPKRVGLSDEWNAAVEAAVASAAAELGLPAERLEARLYKLLIYEKGGFFRPHRDNEKAGGMIGSMIVMPPSSFGGGELVIEHGDSRRTFPFGRAARGEAAEYAAFYADCRHEVRRVSRGVRVCLAYNLSLKTSRRKRATGKDDAGGAELDAAIGQWLEARPDDPLVFALEHRYSPSGLKPDLLKGNDRQTAEALMRAAERSGCRVHFGQVSRHIVQEAYDGSFGRGRRRCWYQEPANTSELELGDVIVQEMVIDGWKDARGKRVRLGELPLDSSTLVSTIPLEQWQPTSEDYEGYTGNAGNTLDRWYHASALVIWSDAHHFDVIARTGMRNSIETFQSMRAKLVKTPEKRLEQACADCEALARAIIRRWPNRLYRSAVRSEDEPWLAEFAAELLELEDPDLFGEFLRTVALRDWTLRLDAPIIDACRRFGPEEMKPILIELLSTQPEPNRYGHRPAEGLAERDASWLCRLARDRRRGGLAPSDLAQLLGIALDRFAEQVRETDAKPWSRSDEFGRTLVLLLKAAFALDEADSAERLLELSRAFPKHFKLRTFQVKAAIDLAKWTEKQLGRRPPALDSWIAEIRNELRAATEAEPQPPADYARDAKTGCPCRYCAELAAFLRDPSKATTKIAAKEESRMHLDNKIHSQRLDVATAIERTGRPYSLVLTKTQESYERALRQYHDDQRLLGSLPG